MQLIGDVLGANLVLKVIAITKNVLSSVTSIELLLLLVIVKVSLVSVATATNCAEVRNFAARTSCAPPVVSAAHRTRSTTNAPLSAVIAQQQTISCPLRLPSHVPPLSRAKAVVAPFAV